MFFSAFSLFCPTPEFKPIVHVYTCRHKNGTFIMSGKENVIADYILLKRKIKPYTNEKFLSCLWGKKYEYCYCELLLEHNGKRKIILGWFGN